MSKIVLCIVENLSEFLKDPTINSMILSDTICRIVTSDKIKKFNEIHEIDQNLKQKYFNEYFKEFSEKWSKKDRIIYHQLQKVTNFTKIEIQNIQDEYNRYLENKNSEKNIEEEERKRKGVSKKDFIEIMKLFQKSEKLKAKEFVNLDEEDILKVFDIFDDYKSNSLDFRYE